VLARWEVKEFEENLIPNCSKHRHVKVSEAEDMTGGRLYFRPIARWIGEDGRRITMLAEHFWMRRRTDGGNGPEMLNLVERR
jgi:hypothetical protein